MIGKIFATIGIFCASIYPAWIVIKAIVDGFMKALNIMEVPYFALGLFATRKFKPAKTQHKYAIIIPGRNEEAVIGNLIDSIHKQDYPMDKLTIFVCADNCTDNTAKIARENGAICYEHNNPNERTKGFALQYLFDQIEKDYGTDSFEGYFIFDADNLLKKDYISRMNDSFDAGEKIITSYRATKNLNDGFVSSLYAIHWLRSVRTKHRPRSFLHLATNIQGTGFLFTNEIVKNGWHYTSLTEDRALTADSVVNGYEISFNYDAVFYDEQPTNLKVALRQRLRWAKGHLQAFVESGWGLFVNIFWDRHTVKKEGDHWYNYLWRTIRHRFMAFDTFAQLLPKQIVTAFKWIIGSLILYPCMVFVNGAVMHPLKTSTYLSKLLVYLFGNIAVNIDSGLVGWLTCLGLVIVGRLYYRFGKYFENMLMAVYIFIIEHKRLQKISLGRKIFYCFTWPLYDIIERYVKLIALFVKVEWKPIPHKSTVKIDDLK